MKKKIAGQKSRATVPLKEGNWPEIAESCGIAEVKFERSAMAVLQLFLVRNSAIDLEVRNIAELRTKIADAHLWL